jgi:sulfatase modifying factor 1
VIRIERTWFTMGSAGGAENERPLHRVWVDAFDLAAHQVTNAEYALFAPPPYRDDPRFNDPRQPVVGVSWFDAVRYCEWRGVRLPTEAEWECAARGGAEGKLYPWGDDPRAEYATRLLDAPERVGLGAPNGYGLYDMCENVHEWCSDWYAADFYAVAPERNPRGPERGARRVSRGGSWRHRVKISRCAARSSLPPDYRYADYGFRVAASAGC